MFANNRDGTFTEVSGAVGMDFLEDSRAFALADIDHDWQIGGHSQESQRSASARASQCDDGDWRLDLVPLARVQKQPRCHWCGGNSGDWKAAPDQISASRIWISVAALEGAFLRRRQSGRSDSCDGSLAQQESRSNLRICRSTIASKLAKVEAHLKQGHSESRRQSMRAPEKRSSLSRCPRK